MADFNGFDPSLAPFHPQRFAKSQVLSSNHLSVILPHGDSLGFPIKNISISPHNAPEHALRV